MNPAPLLLLHHRYTPEDQAIWREAIRRGWRTERIGSLEADIKNKLEDRVPDTLTRFYGNILLVEEAASHLPIIFPQIRRGYLALKRFKPFVKRNIAYIQAQDVFQPLLESLFYKSENIKWIESRVYKQGESFICKPEDYLYEQELCKLTSEVRCFVIDGEIVTSSYYRNTKGEFEIHNIPEPLSEHVKMTEELWKLLDWPRGIVFDFALNEAGEWLFLEANEAWASGLYDCDPSQCFDTIIASQKDKQNEQTN